MVESINTNLDVLLANAASDSAIAATRKFLVDSKKF